MENLINKTMDFDDLRSNEANEITNSLNDLITVLRDKNLKISSWYGSFDLLGKPDAFEKINRGYGYKALDNAIDDANFPWFLYWEIIWIVLNNNFEPGDKVLDLGGSSSLFSYYMASKGLYVTTVDIQEELVRNANLVAAEMNWNLKNYTMDMRDLDMDEQFDHITSICVYEHIPMFDRVKINSEVKKLLLDNGRFSITFDYRNPSMAANISTPETVDDQFVKPSGLSMRGNKNFHDNGKNYLLSPFFFKSIPYKYKLKAIARKHFSPLDFFKYKQENDYTFGALFLEKNGIS